MRTILLIFFFCMMQIARAADSTAVIPLPPPARSGVISLEQLLSQRRSIREYSPDSLALSELSQLLWAAQGITSPEGLRTAPSAGATYPLEIFAVVQRVHGLNSGVYHYQPRGYELESVSNRDPADGLSRAAFGRLTVTASAVSIIVVSVTERTAAKYGDRAHRYVILEAGHAAQNVLLQAEALGLAAVPVGSFDDAAVQDLVESRAEPLYILCVGRRLR
jgi:SagB-type dehydrogenase family enzyme